MSMTPRRKRLRPKQKEPGDEPRVDSLSRPRLNGRRVVLAVCGSIAAYKALSLLRLLKAEGADVRVVLTSSAAKFVTPLTFEVLSQGPVATDLFAVGQEMRHLAWAEEAQAIVIAPCTAHTLAKIALGLADDLLGSLLLAARCPLILAPAMDGGMWDHPTVQSHVTTLRARGAVVLDPEIGPLASGRTGRGRLPEEQVILKALIKALSPLQDFAGERVLVSAGPTHEPIDPVRYLSNRSSGKMGYAIAEAAAARGAEVVLVTGPTALTIPTAVQAVPVKTAEEMHKALTGHLAWATIVIMAAAVADFRPVRPSGQKIKKDTQPMTALELEPTPDILADLSRRRTTQFLAGFAAETQELVAHARTKLNTKGLDLIVGNNVLAEGSGFGSGTNQIILLDRTGRLMELPLMTKRAAADALLDRVRELRTGNGNRPRTAQTR